ncbi:MAG: YvcK family protein, partial [Actinobacteria bacterium]|nr:YvcK family protein [Actinomycetota bacterium]
ASALGDFNVALEEAGRLLGAVGRVLPATSVPVVLKAEAADGPVEGQVRVSATSRISGVGLVPPDAAPPPAVLRAIAEADQVVIGPGSLFTSVLAVIAVPAIRSALAATKARTVYVANLRPQAPETAGFDVAAHVAALASHGLHPDVVLRDPAALPLGDLDVDWVDAPLAAADGVGHDPARLAAALMKLIG